MYRGIFGLGRGGHHFLFCNRLAGKRELVALLKLSSWYLLVVSVLWLFLTVPWVVYSMNVVFPGHTQSLFVLAKDLKTLTDFRSFNCILLHKVRAACF